MDADAADQPRRALTQLRRLAVALVFLAALVWMGRWCFVRATTRARGDVTLRSLFQEHVARPPVDVSAAIGEAIAGLPAEPDRRFTLEHAYSGEWSPETRPYIADVMRYLELDEVRRALEAISQHLEEGIGFDMEYAFSGPREAARLFLVRARYRWDGQGDHAGAIDDLRSAAQLVRMCFECPTLSTLLIGVNIREDLNLQLRCFGGDPQTSAPLVQQLADLANEPLLNVPPSLRNVLATENAMLRGMLDMYFTAEGWMDIEAALCLMDGRYDLDSPIETTTAGGIWNVFSPAFRLRGEVEQTIAANVEAALRTESVRGRELAIAMRALRDRMERMSILEGPLREFSGTVYGVYSARAGLLEPEATRAALAIELHRRRVGAIPESLSALVPELLPRVPPDLFGDGALGYRKVGDAYVLYSVGTDGVDDGGVEPKYRRNGWRSEPDIIYRTRRQPANERDQTHAIWTGGNPNDVENDDANDTAVGDPNAVNASDPNAT